MDPYHALVEATVQRARPVILTALAAVFAFIPLTFSVFWGSLAFTLIGGTIGGTVEFVEPHHLQHELARCAFGFERFDDPARLRLHFVEQQRRSEEHTSELQSLMRISYAVFCLKKKTKKTYTH